MAVDWKEIWRYRDMFLLFVARNFRTAYKQTILGPLWFIITPVLSVIVYVTVFGGIANIPTDGVPPMLFYLLGISVWGYFASCVSATSNSFVSNADIFGKVYFPRIIMPLVAVTTNLLSFAIQLAIFTVLYIYYVATGTELVIHWQIVLFPLFVAMLAFMAVGFGMIFSSMTTKYRDLQIMLAKIISLFLGFLILIRTYAVWMAERHIIRPVNSIAHVSRHSGYDTPEAREKWLKMLDALNIRTGDEIETLYEEYKTAARNTVRYIEETQRKSEQLAKMQNGLILVLADMVESRDQCTGDHVFKTAAYTEIILRQMQKDGFYAEQLSEEYIDEVVRSAPLHDVGKIAVSDVILNKPGRLTDEEFRIMQSHTTEGGKIIDKAMALVDEDSGYLNEAKNLALYHHEKWNGKGYPTGLKEEEIPLSARVMAVADVFDALVSRRSYKEPFTIEKALEIIRTDAGTHFDPLVAQAFLNAEDEVRRVAKMQMEP